ncbi:MAG TPA: hypothetical protein IAA98_07935 [Candidatus Avipropionibacterium avicola]|uniref:Uncharacterized protein n=1 Tax=Candidatus Avipropionibacterium avicola TaxID=2840701 RepID=A0A9D1KLQ3_9ACTN|nr:hypothetical protein [Candidatus Avipropionibacterium avicola]
MTTNLHRATSLPVNERTPDEEVQQRLSDRNEYYWDQLQGWFRATIVDEYRDRVEQHWKWDHSGPDPYVHSVSGQREQWKDLLAAPDLTAEGDAMVSQSDVIADARWIEVPVGHGLCAQGLLLMPPRAKKLIVFQHGLGSSPERVLGLGKPKGRDGYHGIGQTLVDKGYAVLAPMNLVTIDPRNRAQDLARLAGTTVEGIELARCRVLIDAVAGIEPTLNTEAMALVGISWGGLAALYWTPVEPRFVAAASIAFFNDRCQKMVVEDPEHYVTFAARSEHHAFLHGHLGIFGDAELASLICPRPFLVQHGDADAIGWTPQIEAEFARAHHHWQELGLADRAELQVHSGGHEVLPSGLLNWLARHFPHD